MAACAIVVMLLAVTAGVAAAQQQRSVAWDRFDVDLGIQSNGDLRVTETQAIRFQGTYQQGFRVIPTDRVTGIDSVSVAEVVNGQTQPYRQSLTQTPNAFRTSNTDQGLRIDWWFPATTDATRTFVLSYTAHGALRIYDAGDQLQWKAIYADRPGPVASSTVTVHLPGDVSANALQTAFYRFTLDQESQLGGLPANGSGQQTDARTVQFAIGQLPAESGAETRVQFPHGLVNASPPPWQQEADRADAIRQTIAPIGGFVALLLTLVVLAGGGIALFMTWYTAGRDPGAGAVPARLDAPPSDLPAPLAGTLVDEVADVQDAIATLVDLADRGVLSMRDETNTELAGSSRDARLTLHVALEEADLRQYERYLLEALFGPDAAPNAEVLLSSVRERFMGRVPMIQDALHRAVAAEGLFVRDPDAVRRRYRQLGWVLVFGGIAAAVVASVALGWAIGIAWLPGAALAIVGIACVLVARAMPRRTPAGAVEAARWKAFRAHLTSAESANRPELLPYAIAFGVDRSFLQRLESVGTPPPRWYPGGNRWGGPGGVIILPGGYGPWGGVPGPHHQPRGGDSSIQAPGAPNPQGWSDSLADLLNAASNAMAHGGGSGGWSGGGFGGGGGGGGGSGGFN